MGEHKGSDRSKKEQFLTAFEQTSGYVEYRPQSEFDQGDAWQFRFSLQPDSENITKAMKVATKILCPDDQKEDKHYHFKFFALNAPHQNTFKAIGCDGSHANFEAPSDRDQGTKEFCLYMRQTYFDTIELFPPDAKITKEEISPCTIALKLINSKEIEALWRTPNGINKKTLPLHNLTQAQRDLLQFPEQTTSIRPILQRPNPLYRGLVDCINNLCDGPKLSEKTPEQWKQLILSLWQAFDAAGVKLGYASPQIGDKALPTTEGLISPVSYVRATKIWDGILREFWEAIRQADIPLSESTEITHPSAVPLAALNDHLYEAYAGATNVNDPLAGVCITPHDLKEARIPLKNNLSMQISRIQYSDRHLLASLTDITTDLQQEAKKEGIEETKEDIKQLLEKVQADFTQISESLSSTEALSVFIETHKTNIQRIIHFFPMTATTSGQLMFDAPLQQLSSLYNHPTIEDEKKNIIQSEKNKMGRALTAANDYASLQLTQIDALRNQEKRRIYQLFFGDRNIMAFLLSIDINPTKLQAMIAANLGQMELFYRRLRQIKKKKISLLTEQYSLYQQIKNHIKKGNFAQLRAMVFIPGVLLPVIIGASSSALSMYQFNISSQQANLGLLGDQVTDAEAIILAGLASFIIGIIISGVVYQASRYFLDRQLLDRAAAADAKNVVRLLGKGANPEYLWSHRSTLKNPSAPHTKENVTSVSTALLDQPPLLSPQQKENQQRICSFFYYGYDAATQPEVTEQPKEKERKRQGGICS